MKKGDKFHALQGFTLVELMVTLAIAAILATIAAPMLGRFVAKSQMTSVKNDLQGAFQLARTEAVTRNVCVSVCRRAANGASQCAGDAGAWSAGWIVFTNAACTPTVDAADPPAGTALRMQGALPASITANTANGQAPEVVVFSPRGGLVNLGAAGTFALRDARYQGDASMQRNLVVNQFGHIHAEQ